MKAFKGRINKRDNAKKGREGEKAHGGTEERGDQLLFEQCRKAAATAW